MLGQDGGIDVINKGVPFRGNYYALVRHPTIDPSVDPVGITYTVDVRVLDKSL